MARQDFYSRRTLLFAGVTGLTAGVAGCSGLSEDEGNGSRDTDGSDGDNGDDAGDDSGPEYELRISTEHVDLSDLKNWEHNSDEIRTSDYAELEITLYEDDEPVEPDQLEISSTDQLEYDLEDSLYRIKCTELESGRNQLEVEAEYDGKEITDTVNVEKTTPDQYLLQGSIEFENGDTTQIIPSSTPYKFDKHVTDYEEYSEKRLTGVENNNVPEAVEKFDPETVEDVNDKIELIETVADHVRDIVGGHSGSAGTQAATEETIIRQHTDFEDVYAAGFDNPADRTEDITGNHGSKNIYIDGDWYHVETTHTEVKHIHNINEASMVSGLSLSNFVSILGEFEKGDMEELNYRTKMNRKQGMYVGNTVPSGIITTSDMTVSDPFGSEGLEMKRDNKPRKEIYAAPILSADHFLQTSKPGIIFGTPDQPEILVTENRRLHERVEEQIEYQELETILEKL